MTTQGAFLALWQLGVAFLIGFGVGAGVTWLIDVAIARWYGTRQAER